MPCIPKSVSLFPQEKHSFSTGASVSEFEVDRVLKLTAPGAADAAPPEAESRLCRWRTHDDVDRFPALVFAESWWSNRESCFSGEVVLVERGLLLTTALSGSDASGRSTQARRNLEKELSSTSHSGREGAERRRVPGKGHLLFERFDRPFAVEEICV